MLGKDKIGKIWEGNGEDKVKCVGEGKEKIGKLGEGMGRVR